MEKAFCVEKSDDNLDVRSVILNEVFVGKRMYKKRIGTQYK